MKKDIPQFVIDYDKKLKKQCNKINNLIKLGKELYYNKERIVEAEFESFRISGWASEAYLITENNKRWNVGSEIFKVA